MKHRGFVLILLAGLGGCISHPPSKAPDAYSGLAGTWDEEAADMCTKPHLIRFDDGGSTMTVVYADVGWITEEESRKVMRYRILDAGPSILRVQLENEPRLDDDGKPVVWHVVQVDEDTYCWGRDDWPKGACTTPRRRCAN